MSNHWPGKMIKPCMQHPVFIMLFGVLMPYFSPGAATIEVGPGRSYPGIEKAYAAANSGDTILVYPQNGGAAYQQVALLLRNKTGITISGRAPAGGRVALDGRGYNYSGSGSVPRAMFQFSPGSEGSLVENFEIKGCSNNSQNGAAFRINQTNDITIRNCHIHNNDMGIMSNGSVSHNSAANQLIEDCLIHGNGNLDHAGYNHNLYLGGASVTLRGCDIHSALTGHNVKSRAHITIVEGCYVHDCNNREFDLVDGSGNTDIPGSHALISGCLIVKHPDCTGNKTVIHFGQDGSADHSGVLHLVHCTIITRYISPVVDLSSQNAGVRFFNTLIMDPTGSVSNQRLVNAGRNNASAANAGGRNLWISRGFSTPPEGSFQQVKVGAEGERPAFLNASEADYRPAANFTGVVNAGSAVTGSELPSPLQGRVLLKFRGPLGALPRTFVGQPDIGAFEWGETAGHKTRALVPIPSGNRVVGIFDISGRTQLTKPAEYWNEKHLPYGTGKKTGVVIVKSPGNSAVPVKRIVK